MNLVKHVHLLIYAVDDRCGMELDETDPAIWLKLEAAIDEYIQSNSQVLKNVCERLTLPFLNDEKWCENLRPRFMNGKQPNRRGIYIYIYFQIICA